MLVTIGEPLRKKRTGILPQDTMYKPDECKTQDGIYQIIMPMSEYYESLLVDKINIWDVYIEDKDARLYIPSAWLTKEDTNISIEFDTYTYGAHVKNPFDRKRKKKTCN
jgi:hypothetical protein